MLCTEKKKIKQKEIKEVLLAVCLKDGMTTKLDTQLVFLSQSLSSTISRAELSYPEIDSSKMHFPNDWIVKFHAYISRV